MTRNLAERLLFLPDTARNMGIHLMAGRGSGKSRLMGRCIAWQDFIRGASVIIVDPVGVTISNFLDKVIRLPEKKQAKLFERIVYVDMSGRGERIHPFPLYYRLGDDESCYEIAQRFLNVIRSSDVGLLNAPIQGWNAVKTIGTNTGMVLGALNLQVTEAEDLLLHPQAWTSRLHTACARYPDIERAVTFFTDEYPRMSQRDREMLTRSFLNKVAPFRLDRRHMAMFGASEPGFTWWEVAKHRKAVLLDFRRVTEPDERSFKMHWVFDSFFSFIKYRGPGRWAPISFVVDELANLSHSQVKNESPFAKSLDELINVYARNCMVWLTLCHQELFQLEERIRPTLMSLGTQILGVTSDRDAALAMAKQLVPIDPDMVKRYDPIYASHMGLSEVIDTRPVTYTPQEQQFLASNKFTDKRLFEFLVRPAAAEGDITTKLYNVNIKNFDKGQWPDTKRLSELRAQLSAQTGIPAADILSQIAARQNAILSSPPPAYDNNIHSETADDNEEDYLTEERD
jgi:hypothetical protein